MQVNEIGFNWRETENRESDWDKMFERLKQFRSENPDRWPRVGFEEEEGKIGRWCSNIKQRIRNQKNIKVERLKKLEEIGFDINANNIKDWNEWFDELNNFKLENLNCKLPSIIEGNPNPLYGWVERQKRNYKKGSLSEGQINKILSLGIKL